MVRQQSSSIITPEWEYSCVCVCVCVMRTYICIMTQVLHRYYKEKVTYEDIVSASDVTPTDCWLNVWCIWHTYLETLQECRSHRRIGWIIQDFQETCVSRSLTFRLETKMPWRQNPSRKKKAVVFTNVTTSAYQDQLNAGFSKVCEIFKVRSKESLKYIREFHTCLLLWWHFHAFPSSTLNETNCDWLFDMSVKRPHGGPWPINAAIYSRPSAVSLKVWLRETNEDITPCPHFSKRL